MGLRELHGSWDDGASVATIHRAIDLAVGLLDTADMDRPFLDEEFVGRG